MNLDQLIYGIGKNGFLGEENDVILSPEYYDVFGDILDNLKEQDGVKFRLLVKNLPTKPQQFYLEFIKDRTDNEIKKIYNDFTFICQKYIWCCGQGKGDLVHSIPYSIGLIWYYCGIHRVVRPVSTYDALILNNWKFKDKDKPVSLDNLDVVHSITGTDDEIWFYKIHIMIEYVGRIFVNKIIKPENIFTTKESAIVFLTEADEMIKECIRTMARINSGCSPDSFWNILRIYLSGFEKKDIFPDGMHIEGTDIYLTHKGGSGASSPLIQAIDSFFEIEHTMNKGIVFKIFNNLKRILWMRHKSPDGSELIKDMRQYMSFKHRLYLKNIRNNDFSLRKHVHDMNDKDVTKKYNDCLGTLNAFRVSHVKVVKDYIIHYLDLIDEEKKNGGISVHAKNNVQGKGGTSSLASKAKDNHALAILLYDISDDVKDMKIKFDKIDYYMNSTFIKYIDYIVIPAALVSVGMLVAYFK
jgi:indoleamine 2,3-dioxygenase